MEEQPKDDEEIRRQILRRLLPNGATTTAAELESDTLRCIDAEFHLTYLETIGAVEVAETMHEGEKVIRVFRSTPAGQRFAAN